MGRIWVRLKDHPTKQVCINESDYDANKHILPTKEEKEADKVRASINIKEICSSRTAPGMHMKLDDSRGSVTHNHKLDSGAAGDLLDKGLDGAKKRVKERTKKQGTGYRKIKNLKAVPRKHKKMY